MILSKLDGTMSGDCVRLSTASTMPSFVRIAIAVLPSLIASMAYST